MVSQGAKIAPLRSSKGSKRMPKGSLGGTLESLGLIQGPKESFGEFLGGSRRSNLESFWCHLGVFGRPGAPKGPMVEEKRNQSDFGRQKYGIRTA